MSWLGIEHTKDDDKGLPDGFDSLPSLGERDEAPLIDPEKAASEVKEILARLKNPPAPSARKLFVWEKNSESINKILADLPPDPPAPEADQVEQPLEPAPPVADPYEVRALDALSAQVEELTAKMAAFDLRAAERQAPVAIGMERAGKIEIIKDTDTGLITEVRRSDGEVGKVIRDETLGVMRIEYFRPKK